MKNVEKHINEIVSKVLSEQVALKAEEIMSMANEELHGGQKKLDKNNKGRAIGICTKTIINNKGFTRGKKFTCKKKQTIRLSKTKKYKNYKKI